jgi:type IV secretory pathway VirB10-like protein
MIMDRRKWQYVVIGGLLAAIVLAAVIMVRLQNPDSVMAEGEDPTGASAEAQAELGASGVSGSGIIGTDEAETPPPEAGVVPPAGTANDAAAAAAAEEDPAVALARERARRENEALLAKEAAAREAKILAEDGVIGQGLYQPDPTVLDRMTEAGTSVVPARADGGLEASLDPALAALSGPATGQSTGLASGPGEFGAPSGNAQGVAVAFDTQAGSGVAGPSGAAAGMGGPDVGYLAHGAVAARSPYEIKKGSVIPATLISEVNSDLPGSVTAQVRDDVYDTTTGGTLLIPKGARLYGQYDSGVEYGQRRAVVLWSHLIFPDGSTLLLEDMMGADAAGRSGFADKRRGNFLTMLGGNLLFSVLDAGERAAQAQIAQSVTGSAAQSDIDQLVSQVSRGTSPTAGSSAASIFNTQTAGTKPTLMIRTGYRFNIMVGKDIVLEPWQG